LNRDNKQADPPGKTKLIAALRHLLEEKNLNSITTAEISNAAGVNEALIYRYFGGKRGLLHRVLAEYLEKTLDSISPNLENVDDPANLLEQIIHDTMDIYNWNRVFAKIVLVEVRSSIGYFESNAYQLAKNYARLYVNIIKKGMEKGQFRSDIHPNYIRDALIGSMEQMTMPDVIYGRDINVNAYTQSICEIIYNGVAVREYE
jgi:AcrR family transcriptional regulator